MAWRDVNVESRAAKGEFLAVSNLNVAVRYEFGPLRRRLQAAAIRGSRTRRGGLLLAHCIPIDLAGDQMRAIGVMQILRSSEVIPVGVRDKDVLDLSGLQAKLLQTSDDEFLGLVRVVQRVDEDDPFAGLDRPGRDGILANEIEIVKDFFGRNVTR